MLDFILIGFLAPVIAALTYQALDAAFPDRSRR